MHDSLYSGSAFVLGLSNIVNKLGLAQQPLLPNNKLFGYIPAKQFVLILELSKCLVSWIYPGQYKLPR